MFNYFTVRCDKLLLREQAHSHGNDTSRRRVDRQFWRRRQL